MHVSNISVFFIQREFRRHVFACTLIQPTNRNIYVTIVNNTLPCIGCCCSNHAIYTFRLNSFGLVHFRLNYLVLWMWAVENFALKQQSSRRFFSSLWMTVFCVFSFFSRFAQIPNNWMDYYSIRLIDVLIFRLTIHFSLVEVCVCVACAWLCHFMMRANWECIFRYFWWKCVWFFRQNKFVQVCHVFVNL